MPGLLDLAPPEMVIETIEIRGEKMSLRAMSSREWAALLRRFPQLDPDAPKQAAADMADSDIETAKAVIAIGLNHPGDEVFEAAVETNLSSRERKKLFDIVMKLTNPDPEPGPLAEAGAHDDGAGLGRASDMSLPPLSSN